MLRALHAFLKAREGNVTLVSALVLPAVLAVAGMATEYGNALNYKSTDQRVADAAAFGTATVYNADDSISVTSVAQSIAALNGVPSANVSAAVVTSPSGSGNNAVRVTVTSQAPLVLSKLIAPAMTSLNVSATAYAELKGGTPACVVALKSSGTGVSLTGGTTVTAQQCGVDSDAAVSVPCGTTITTTNLAYNSSAAPSQPCNGIQAPAGKTLSIKKQATPDPLAGNSEVTTAQAREATTRALTSPGAPTAVAGTNPNFGYSGTPSLPAGCTSAWNSGTSTWTVTCTGAGPFNFGTPVIGGGIILKLVTSGTNQVYNFTSLPLTAGGTFGTATYNIARGLDTSYGTVTFAGGTFNFGTGDCGNGYSLCVAGGGHATFNGPSSFVFSGGIQTNGGTSLVMGSGTGNSFRIGRATNGDSFTAGSGAGATFADATTFQMAGNFNGYSAGGSCTYIGAATYHDINGFLSAAGGVTVGSGLYTVNGYVAFGAGGGGDVTCGGQTVGVLGHDVTFDITAATTLASGTCANQAFCVGAGYGHVSISAPTSGSTAKLLMVGPTSGTSTAGATFTGGASGTTLSGAFYFPQGAISLSGAASVGSGAGQCLELIGSQVSLSGGSAVASSCISSSASGGSVVLVG